MTGVIDRLPESKAHLVLVGPRGWGTGPIKAAFERSGLGNRTTFFGAASEEELVLLYNAAWAFAFPSTYEGFGLPVLEAMASGCPVITTRAGSLEEVADSAAYFVDPNDVDSIKKGIEEVMSDVDLRSALSKKGLSQAKKFSWEKVAKETMSVYEKILTE